MEGIEKKNVSNVLGAENIQELNERFPGHNFREDPENSDMMLYTDENGNEAHIQKWKKIQYYNQEAGESPEDVYWIGIGAYLGKRFGKKDKDGEDENRKLAA